MSLDSILTSLLITLIIILFVLYIILIIKAKQPKKVIPKDNFLAFRQLFSEGDIK